MKSVLLTALKCHSCDIVMRFSNVSDAAITTEIHQNVVTFVADRSVEEITFLHFSQ